MEDPEVVAAIVAGDPAGLAEAYDRYAVPLYSYCRSVLREPADAADAVQDTFLVATARLRGLSDPGKLRSWLYAVAHNECLRRRRAANAFSALEAAAGVATEPAEIGAATEQADLRDLVRAAIDGLNPGEREVIELSIGHEFDGEDLATALGVSRNHAHALLSRARGQLERSLGALIVARTGRQACTDLDAMLAGWDGQLTAPMRKRLSRHIEQCEVCGERKRRELSSALFAGAMPLAALFPAFREQLLRVLADRTPAGLAHRLSVANRAGPFGPTGFPKPVHPPGAAPWHRVLHHPHATVAGAATSVMTAGAIAAVVIAGPQHGALSAGPASGSTHGASAGLGSLSPAHGGPSAHAGNRLAPPPSTRGGSISPVAYSSPSSAAGPGPVPGSSSSAPGASSSSAPPSARAGTLSVSTDRLELVPVNGTPTGTFTLTARGGPVSDYSITVEPALASSLTVSPSAGSLASGASVTITVTSTSLVTLGGKLTVNPGGQTITVALSPGL
jgi:RNA polymerase sigma factor (sigma-70 family)